jgi:Flp pilus assembly pilin Flp
MKNFFRKFSSSKASSLVEYALLIATISIVSIGSLNALGFAVTKKFDNISYEIENLNNAANLGGPGANDGGSTPSNSPSGGSLGGASMPKRPAGQ